MSCNCNPCLPGIPEGTSQLIAQHVYNYNIPGTNEKRYRIVRQFKIEDFGFHTEQSNELTEQQLVDAIASIPGITFTQVA